jgi:hypothetical protein
MNIDNLIREHKSIWEEINFINEKIIEENLLENLLEMTSHINKLAGKLKIHLGSEDKFLYPNLLNDRDSSIKQMANSYIHEMGGIADTFTTYKDKFNVYKNTEFYCDIEDLKNAKPSGFVFSELKREISQALTKNRYIKSISDFETDYIKEELQISFAVNLIDGSSLGVSL